MRVIPQEKPYIVNGFKTFIGSQNTDSIKYILPASPESFQNLAIPTTMAKNICACQNPPGIWIKQNVTNILDVVLNCKKVHI